MKRNTHTSTQRSLTLESIPTEFGYPDHYVEHVADCVGEGYAVKAFLVHEGSKQRFMDMGISPLQLSAISRRLSLPQGFEQGLHALVGARYDQPVNPAEYQTVLNSEFKESQRSTLCNEFPQATNQIPDVINFLKGSARTALSYYFNNEGLMKERMMSLPAFAYLVSQLQGPIEARLSIAPHLPTLAKQNSASLDYLIRTYNTHAGLSTSVHSGQDSIQLHPCARIIQGTPHQDTYRFNPERLLLGRLELLHD